MRPLDAGGGSAPRAIRAAAAWTAALVALCAVPPGAAASDHFATTEVELRNGDVSLAGSLVLPDGDGPHPAIVFLHGSGPMSRAGGLSYARRYAELGFAGLAFDKRGVGESGGSWFTASLTDLARDAIAAVELLKARDDIDPSRIGFWGVSQAGWVAARATELTDDVAFLVIISGGGATPYESEMFSYRTAFAHAGLSAEETEAGLSVIEDYFAYLGSGEGKERVERRIAEAEGSAWFPHARLDRILPSSEEGRRIWSWVATWDPRPATEKMTLPVLVLFGGKDTQAPPELSIERWREGLEAAGNESYTIEVFPEAGHGIRAGRHGSSGERPPFADGYHETIERWLVEVAAQAR